MHSNERAWMENDDREKGEPDDELPWQGEESIVEVGHGGRRRRKC